MNEINDEINLTINMIQDDICGVVKNELLHHLVCLLEIKRDKIQSRIVDYIQEEPTKTLTTEQQKAWRILKEM